MVPATNRCAAFSRKSASRTSTSSRSRSCPIRNFSTVKVPNPEDPAAFTLAMKLADEVGADCIFGTDPDCDRVGIAVQTDDAGKHYLMTGNQIGCVLLYYILKSRKALGNLPADGAVVKSVVSTELARAIAESFGLRLLQYADGLQVDRREDSAVPG